MKGRREVPAVLQFPVEGIMVDQDRTRMAKVEVVGGKVVDWPVEAGEAVVAAQCIGDLKKMVELKRNKDQVDQCNCQESMREPAPPRPRGFSASAPHRLFAPKLEEKERSNPAPPPKKRDSYTNTNLNFLLRCFNNVINVSTS